MDRERVIPKGGWNPYGNHPGFDAQGCEFQIVVTGRKSIVTDNGFACYHTGGHCLPGSLIHCPGGKRK